MGTTYSYGEKEKDTWKYHCLLFDQETRETNLGLIDTYFPDDSEIQLAKLKECRGGLDYQHYFITDTKQRHYLELSSLCQNSDEVYETYRVQCNTLPHVNYEICEKKQRV